MYVFEVEVSTHDDLKRGVVAVPRWSGVGWQTFGHVFVDSGEVSSDQEAWMLAWQMAAASSGRMPTRVRMIDW